LGQKILTLQAILYQKMQAAFRVTLNNEGNAWPLLGLSMLYGVLHAAGPGHGKSIIAAYIVGTPRALRQGITLSVAAALIQAVVAIVLVVGVQQVFQLTVASLTTLTNALDLAALAALLVVAGVLAWRASGLLLARVWQWRTPDAPLPSHLQQACGHVHVDVSALPNRRTQVGIALAAGLRPCTGALIVLAFALANNAVLIGIAGVLAMAVGTALTTSLIAAFAVFFKEAALKVASLSVASPRRAPLLKISTAVLAWLASSALLCLGGAIFLGLITVSERL
jgi:nickel/cobalt transporter (NicO) family protein